MVTEEKSILKMYGVRQFIYHIPKLKFGVCVGIVKDSTACPSTYLDYYSYVVNLGTRWLLGSYSLPEKVSIVSGYVVSTPGSRRYGAL